MTAAPADSRTILHIDMDAFFAAIEQLDNPALRGKPVVVGAPPDRRGVVATASYEARTFGIHSAMPSRTAGKLCPHAAFVPPRFARYEEVSGQLMALLEEFTPAVEPVSIDEAFLDVQSVLHFWPGVEALARELKQRIRTRLSLTASVGIAPNKFLAKIASDLKKPDGLSLAPATPEAIRAFLAPMPVGRIWGVGKVTEKQLLALGLKTIGHLQALAVEELQPLLGEALAAHVHALAFGRDEREILPHAEEKSISNETTFDTDCTDPDEMRATLLELAEQVGRRLRRTGKRARTLHVRIRFHDFRTISRQASFPAAADADREIVRLALALFNREKIRQPVRLLGVGVSNLVKPDEAAPRQALLFPALEERPEHVRNRSLDRAVDRLRERYGTDILRRGPRPPPTPPSGS